MSNRVFITIIAALVIGMFGYVAVKKKDAPPELPRPGIEQPDLGNKHISPTGLPNNGAEPPASGDMTNPVPAGVYDQEIPDTDTIHNAEHGYVYISYRPDLPADQIAKIRALFSKPFSNPKFSPSKAVVAPRAANGSPIIMTSWRRYLKLDAFNEEKMMEYYLRNVGKAPEGTAS